MRKFFRSAAGKTLLFVICILSLIAAALSIAGIVVSFEYADMLYLGDEGQFRDELFLRELRSNGYTQVGRVIRNTAADPDKVMELPDAGNAVFIVRDEQGNIIARSYSADDRLTWQFELDYALILTGATEPGFEYDIWYMGKTEEPDYFAEPYDRKVTVCYGMKDGFPEPDVLKLINR
ncbi:MAG: hypothetical protein J6U30_00560 [Oscillospiraceae bacterium]|nr:hypothetical protein [Oscillospiraceae bacterium]